MSSVTRHFKSSVFLPHGFDFSYRFLGVFNSLRYKSFLSYISIPVLTTCDLSLFFINSSFDRQAF